MIGLRALSTMLDEWFAETPRTWSYCSMHYIDRLLGFVSPIVRIFGWRTQTRWPEYLQLSSRIPCVGK
ncbi:MAG: hypothetical protein QOK24_2742 [Verrucomicrobiota bacterium]|jgi:hypothetical protein